MKQTPTTYEQHMTIGTISAICTITGAWMVGGIWWAVLIFGLMGWIGCISRMAVNRAKGIWP